MKSNERIIADYLNDILESITHINLFLQDIDYPGFKDDIKTQYAVIRALEIIGEASKKIPEEVKENYSWIPWRLMSGMRDKLIHDYFGVDKQVVWNTANDDIKKLGVEIKQIISDFSK